MTYEAAERILELPRRYTKKDLRRAYTDIARRYHPDAAARHHFDTDAAAARMVEANQAYNLLKEQFVGRSDAVIEHAEALAGGYPGVDWRAGTERDGYGDGPWPFAEGWGSEPAPQKAPLSARSVLLGPVALRIAMVCLLAWVWWRTFPLLPYNLPEYEPAGGWTLADVARLVAAMVYPSYFLVYEVLSGYLSGLVREAANGAVSWVTRRYVDLRPHSSSYGCALYKLIREQVYALLMAPVVLWLAGIALGSGNDIVRLVCGVLAVAVGTDMLAACVRGGFINVWSTELADRIETRYLLLRADLLRRCNQWRT